MCVMCVCVSVCVWTYALMWMGVLFCVFSCASCVCLYDFVKLSKCLYIMYIHNTMFVCVCECVFNILVCVFIYICVWEKSTDGLWHVMSFNNNISSKSVNKIKLKKNKNKSIKLIFMHRTLWLFWFYFETFIFIPLIEAWPWPPHPYPPTRPPPSSP